MKDARTILNPQTSADFGRAMDAIRDEMAANSKDTAIQQIGGILTELLRRHPRLAEALAAKGKSMKKALGAMRDAARKQQVDGCACLDGLAGMKIALAYYGIDSITDSELFRVICGLMTPDDRPVDEAVEAAGELDIDALLGEV